MHDQRHKRRVEPRDRREARELCVCHALGAGDAARGGRRPRQTSRYPRSAPQQPHSSAEPRHPPRTDPCGSTHERHPTRAARDRFSGQYRASDRQADPRSAWTGGPDSTSKQAAVHCHRRACPCRRETGSRGNASHLALRLSNAAAGDQNASGLAALLEVDDLREVTARRELYRRCSRLGEMVVEVAERVVYAEFKQS